jgi:SP family general alpha glucoside:H+ symporter-like MFS transporter
LVSRTSSFIVAFLLLCLFEVAMATENHSKGSVSEKHHFDDNQRPIGSSVIAPNDEAQHAASDEKKMSLLQGIKLYPKAVGWSMVLSSALIMEGYLALLGSLFGNDQFKKKYGVLNPASGKYSVPASWQSAL